MQHPLSKRSQCLFPKLGCFRELRGELAGQPTVSVSLLEKPIPLQWRTAQPIQRISINLRANRFHEISRQTVACPGVAMKDSKAGIEAKRRDGEPRFGLIIRLGPGWESDVTGLVEASLDQSCLLSVVRFCDAENPTLSLRSLQDHPLRNPRGENATRYLPVSKLQMQGVQSEGPQFRLESGNDRHSNRNRRPPRQGRLILAKFLPFPDCLLQVGRCVQLS